MTFQKPTNLKKRPPLKARTFRHEFLLNADEERKFRATAEQFRKFYDWPVGSALSETFRFFLENYSVEQREREKWERLEFKKILDRQNEVIEERNAQIAELEIRLARKEDEIL
jgi:hypothetical protein